MQLGVMQYTFDSRVPPCHLNHRSYQRHHYERRVHPPPKIVEKSLCCRILSLIVHLNEFRPLFDDSHVAVRRAGRIFWQLHGGVLVLCNRYWYCWNFFTMVMAQLGYCEHMYTTKHTIVHIFQFFSSDFPGCLADFILNLRWTRDTVARLVPAVYVAHAWLTLTCTYERLLHIFSVNFAIFFVLRLLQYFSLFLLLRV